MLPFLPVRRPGAAFLISQDDLLTIVAWGKFLKLNFEFFTKSYPRQSECPSSFLWKGHKTPTGKPTQHSACWSARWGTP
jgi:hypothetical protein